MRFLSCDERARLRKKFSLNWLNYVQDYLSLLLTLHEKILISYIRKMKKH